MRRELLPGVWLGLPDPPADVPEAEPAADWWTYEPTEIEAAELPY